MSAGVIEVANNVRKISELAFRHGIDSCSSGSGFAILQDVGIVLQGDGGGHGILSVEFRVEFIQGLGGEWLIVQRSCVSLSLIGGDGCFVHIRIGGDQLWGNA